MYRPQVTAVPRMKALASIALLLMLPALSLARVIVARRVPLVRV